MGWIPANDKEKRAIALGLDSYAPRIGDCGTVWKHGIHLGSDRPHRHQENHSRCMGYSCEPCTKARAVKLSATWGQKVICIPNWSHFSLLMFVIPCPLGPTSELTKANLPSKRASIADVKARAMAGLKKLPTFFTMLQILDYHDEGFLYVGIISAHGCSNSTYRSSVVAALEKEFPASAGIELCVENDPSGLHSGEITKGQFPVILQQMLGYYPEGNRVARGTEVQALFYGLHRLESWGEFADKPTDKTQSLENVKLAAESSELNHPDSEVCRDPSTNLSSSSDKPMRCWCGAVCTHVLIGGPEPPSWDEMMRHPVILTG